MSELAIACLKLKQALQNESAVKRYNTKKVLYQNLWNNFSSRAKSTKNHTR